MLYAAFNAWYWQHGWGKDYFQGGPEVVHIFHDIYERLTPGASVAAFHPETSRMMGACFYHPRPQHMSLGIMSVHPNYGGCGVGRALTRYITGLADRAGLPIRLVSSAMNVDSFSLYNQAGFVPRQVYHDMLIPISETAPPSTVPGLDIIRAGKETDVPAIIDLEMSVSGISREIDYRFGISGGNDSLDLLIAEGTGASVDGFLMSLRHPALNMIGPGVARDTGTALALLHRSLDRFSGQSVLVLIPADQTALVRQVYAWGGRNTEVHLFQVRGKYQPFSGINFPSFLPETG